MNYRFFSTSLLVLCAILLAACSGYAPPTSLAGMSREDVVAAIDRFQMQRATAIGSGLILSLATLFPDAGIDLSQITGARAMPGSPEEKKAKKPFEPVEPDIGRLQIAVRRSRAKSGAPKARRIHETKGNVAV